jgi:hypothetical protein
MKNEKGKNEADERWPPLHFSFFILPSPNDPPATAGGSDLI